MKPRILYIVQNYPQLSQTYIKNELKVLWPDYEIQIVAVSTPDVADPDHFPYRRIRERQDIVALVRDFKPAILHSHYLVLADLVSGVAADTATPFTIRSHSFDTIPSENKVAKHLQGIGARLSSDLCLGVLCFPFVRDYLKSVGIPQDKLIASPPVVDFEFFYNRSVNTGGVMNVGAAIRKKRMDDFIDLAKLVPELNFDLFAIGHDWPKLSKLNRKSGNPIIVHQPQPFAAMPQIYKQHRWLVYTACPERKTVGWPMAIAEAQASGTMVCMANIRPDLQEYVGEAGYLYDDIKQAAELLRQPVSAAKRELGFEQARRSDIRSNKHLLTDLWQPHLH